MSTENPQTPPAGEEIHLPGGSLQPLSLAVGTTVFLVGLTVSTWVWAAGIVIVVWTLYLWIRDARREYLELPLHEASGHGGAGAALAAPPVAAPAADDAPQSQV